MQQKIIKKLIERTRINYIRARVKRSFKRLVRINKYIKKMKFKDEIDLTQFEFMTLNIEQNKNEYQYFNFIKNKVR